MKKVKYIVIILIGILLIGLIVYIKSLRDQITIKTKQESGYQLRIRSLEKQVDEIAIKGGLVPTQSVDKTLTELLQSIKDYYGQHKEYPDNENSSPNFMTVIDKYNFSFKSGGPVLQCPADSNYFSLIGMPDKSTGKNTGFELFYCDGDNLKTKTQADL